MRSRGGQTLFPAGKEDDLATRTGHQVHINWVHPSTNCPSEIDCPTPTKRFKLIKMWIQEVSLLTCATSTDDARGRYWKRKANRGGKNVYLVPEFWTLASSLQDDAEEVWAEDWEKDTCCGFCSKQNNWRDSSRIGHWIVCEMLYGTVKTTLAQEAVKGSFMVSAHKEDVRFRMETPCVTFRISYLHSQGSIFINNF